MKKSILIIEYTAESDGNTHEIGFVYDKRPDIHDLQANELLAKYVKEKFLLTGWSISEVEHFVMVKTTIARKKLNGIILTPIQKVGSGRDGTIHLSYDEMISYLGKPNATKLGDSVKVKASWGLKDQHGREIFVWCYRYPFASMCFDWSCCGDTNLLIEIFGDHYEGYRVGI